MSDIEKDYKALKERGPEPTYPWKELRLDVGSGVQTAKMFAEPVLEERGSVYGDYRVNMSCVADMWTAYLTARFGGDFALTASDVPVMMQLLKIGRVATGKYHDDNQKDIRGYGELYDKLAKQENAK